MASFMPTWLHRFILLVSALACVGVIGLLGTVLWQTRAEYARVQQVEAEARQHLAEVEARLAEQEIVLDRLRHDPAYVDRVIRSRLGYVKPEEFVFRFSD
jgi:cell division protein DivIC